MIRNFLSGSVGLVDFIIFIISSAIVVFLTMPIHEFAHGYAAVKLGDNTPRYQGRLSLNPLRHIDPLGALCILILGFGWAKPVRVNSFNLKNPKRDMAIIALAGPLSNVIVALISLIIYNIVIRFVQSLYIPLIFYYIAVININLAVYNLIPVPPLDGSRILGALLPDRTYYKMMQYERYIFYAVLALTFLGVLNVPLNFLSNLLFTGLRYLAQLPFNVIGLLI